MNAPPYSRNRGFAGSAVFKYLRLASVSAHELPSQWRPVGSPMSSKYTQSVVTMFSRVASRSSISVGGVCKAQDMIITLCKPTSFLQGRVPSASSPHSLVSIH